MTKRIILQEHQLQTINYKELNMSQFNGLRYQFLSLVIILSAAVYQIPANAKIQQQTLPELGGTSGGGGDICEKRIREIREAISQWIDHGGSSNLKLPAHITLDSYNQKMKDYIKSASFSCVDEQLYIGDVEKTCKNFIHKSGEPRFVCNTHRFMEKTSHSDQYTLVHHEYASLAVLEKNEAHRSNYEISAQLSGFTTDKIVKMLEIFPVAKPPVYISKGNMVRAILTVQSPVRLGAPGIGVSTIFTFTAYGVTGVRLGDNVGTMTYVSDADLVQSVWDQCESMGIEIEICKKSKLTTQDF